MPIQPGISLRPTVCSYEYDENGLRLEKTVSGTTTEYYYNGSVLIGMKIGTGNNARILRFSYDASGNVMTVAYSTDNGSSFTTYFYLRNAQNDIVKLIDNTGAAVVEYIYDSWGKLLSVTGSLITTLGTDQPFRYRGYVYDTETQWYYLQSRYYDPNTCRFISADVLLPTGQGVIGHNSFAYCLNNSVNLSDPDGYFPGMLNIAVMMADNGGGCGCGGSNDSTAEKLDLPEYTNDPDVVFARANAGYDHTYYKGVLVIHTEQSVFPSSCTLGPIIVLVSTQLNVDTLEHEYGHYLQYKELGFRKYVIGIVIPSLAGFGLSCLCRLLDWNYLYMVQPWEDWANRNSNIINDYSENGWVDFNTWLYKTAIRLFA